MNGNTRKGMTPGRIILLALVLLMGAQLAMISIGLYYAGSMQASIQTQQAQAVASQLEQNISTRLEDFVNLQTILKMPDTSSYFKSFMNLRNSQEALEARGQLQDRLRQLLHDDGAIDSIYFIGENINQESLIVSGDASSLTDIANMRLDSLHYSGLEIPLLSSLDQFVRADAEKMRASYHTTSALLNRGEIDDMDALLRHIDGRLVLIGSADRMLTIFVFNDAALMQQASAVNSQGGAYTLVNDGGEVLWSTTKQPELLRAAAGGASAVSARDGAYTNIIRRITPLRLSLVCSERVQGNVFGNVDLLRDMLAVSAMTLTIALLTSFFYLQLVFRPFRRISRRIHARSEATRGEDLFQPIPEPGHNLFHAFTLRNKLIMLFCVALTILMCADALLYSRLLDGEINRSMAGSAQQIGSLAAIGINDQAQRYDSTANQIATSQKFQNSAMENLHYPALVTETPIVIPGLEKISCYALIGSSGKCFYSSVYAYNSQMFDIASTSLLDQTEPYWVLNYSNPVGTVDLALLRRVQWQGLGGTMWLLIVPRDDAFTVAQTDDIRANYQLIGTQFNAFYSQRLAYDASDRDRVHFETPLDHPGWTLSMEYVFSGVAAMRQAYQERFLFSLFLVFLVASAVVIRVSTVLMRPILQLKSAMTDTWTDGQTRMLEYERSDEIGDIIHSYNRMIVRLEEVTSENLRMLQENAQNKIRENELLSMKARAQFSMLQAQINPHFLHNTLAVIHMQCLRQGDAGTARTVTALADLLRYSISVGSDTATLEEELRNAANYVTIQQVRFGNGFELVVDAPEELKRCIVLRSILQPLIENAIKHGFEGWQQSGRIEVRAQLRDGMLSLSVCDDGVGMQNDTLEALRVQLSQPLDQWHSFGSSIGLKNVYHRLSLRYGGRMRMEVRSALMAGTTVEMIFPAESEPASPGLPKAAGDVPTSED